MKKELAEKTARAIAKRLPDGIAAALVEIIDEERMQSARLALICAQNERIADLDELLEIEEFESAAEAIQAVTDDALGGPSTKVEFKSFESVLGE